MNPPSDIETQLRQLRPADPGADLRRRIAQQLAPAPVRASRSFLPSLRAVLERLCWAGLGATALWLTQGFVQPPAPASSSAPFQVAGARPTSLKDVKPITQEEEISEADEGLRFSPNGAALRKIRRVYLEKTSWPDLAGGGDLEVRWPREELVYLPVSVQ